LHRLDSYCKSTTHQASKNNLASYRALDTLHVALVTHSLYWYMITNFGDYVVLLHFNWSLLIQVAVAASLLSTWKSSCAC
jgi:hypothetical protein